MNLSFTKNSLFIFQTQKNEPSLVYHIFKDLSIVDLKISVEINCRLGYYCCLLYVPIFYPVEYCIIPIGNCN